MLDVEAFVRDNDRWLRTRLRHRIGARGGELDDVLQLAYEQLWRAAPRIDSDQAARAYCLTAAANLARDNARRREVVPAGTIPPGADSSAPDPADLVVRGEIRSAITHAVAGLPPQQRRAWLGYEVHGMTYAALAAHLSLTPAAVRGLLHRARTGLQRNVELAEIALRHHYDAIALHAAALHARTTSRSRSAGWPAVAVMTVAVLASPPPNTATRPGNAATPAPPPAVVVTPRSPIDAPVARVEPELARPLLPPRRTVLIPGGPSVTGAARRPADGRCAIREKSTNRCYFEWPEVPPPTSLSDDARKDRRAPGGADAGDRHRAVSCGGTVAPGGAGAVCDPPSPAHPAPALG